jgi:hypothetical protein
MSRRVYILLAEAIREIPNMSTRSRLIAAARIADVCAMPNGSTNSAFSRALFLKECGLTDEELATLTVARDNANLL